MNEQMRMNLDGARDRCGKLATAAVEAIQFFNDIEKDLKEQESKQKTDGPYIKDPKVRKTIRVWGDMNKIEKAYIRKTPGNDSWFKICGWDEATCFWKIEIHASYSETVSKDYKGNTVPIAELCGEEEE